MPNNKKRSFSKKGKKKAAAEQPISEQELHRFAGSSDEEEAEGVDEYNQDGNEKDDSSQDSQDENSGDEAVEMKAPSHTSSKKPHSKNNQKTAKEDEDAFADEDKDSDDNDDDDSDDDDADFDHYENQQRQKNGSVGMASAMTKILGDFAPAAKKQKLAGGSAVLSKTVTPLQRQLQKEKELAKAMRLKRREKVMNPLPALHIPLSVATTSITLGEKPMSVTHELEQERSHRRVATRGVVALFNAVAQHQKKGPASGEATATSSTSKKSSEQVKKMTKHGFLDMIKTAAAGGKINDTHGKGGPGGGDASTQPKAPASKWAAMQDDYMLNPKKVR